TSPSAIGFPSDQAIVSLRYRADHAGPPGSFSYRLLDSQLFVIAQGSVAPPATGQWFSLVVPAPDGQARIRRFSFNYTTNELIWAFGIDNVGFSPDPRQPDTEIVSGPSGTVASGDAAFEFRANQDRSSFTCRLDAGAAEPCASGKSYTGLADGSHTFTVFATDRWGTADASPATRTWTVRRPVPPRADRDRDGVVDATDNCPDKANSGQGDGDRDGIGDACELLPSGNTPLVAGQFAKVQLVSGEVFVKLPRGAAASAFTASPRAPFQDSGFLPLKGVAAVPMGSTLDTRRGEVALTAAVNGRPASDPRQLRRVARFRAGIFAIRQARLLKGSLRAKRIPPRAELTSAPGAETPCARSAASGPPRGIRVRSLATTAKGVFRTVGGAATATPAKGTATFITTDRCDGTVTEVGRGRVAVIAKSSGRRRVVPAGRAFIVRARLFAAKKGRRPR
ncbi:MAG: thrombospondin type 3 repeat-containing protein, partial [Solirubrobacteraceae bacterium]